MYNSQGQGGKVLFIRRTDFDSLKMQNHLLFITLKHIFQNTVHITPLLFWRCFECYCFAKMSAIVEARRWSLWFFNLRSSLWNLKTSHLRFSLCLYNLPFLFKNQLASPYKPPSKESLHCVLSLSSELLKHSEQCSAQIQANASHWERVETVFSNSATGEISACLYCMLLRSVSEARVLVPKTHSFQQSAVSSRNLQEEVFL